MKLLSLLPLPLALWLTQGQHPHGPPPEAFTACASKAEGDVCTVSFHGTSVEGTCQTHESRLFCMPANMPPPPDGGAPP